MMEVESKPSPEAIWQLSEHIGGLLTEASELRRQLAERAIDTEAARRIIELLSVRVFNLATKTKKYYWFGQAFTAQHPQSEPANPLTANCHFEAVQLVERFLFALQQHDLAEVKEPICTPYRWRGNLDLTVAADIAGRFADKFDNLTDDVDRLRNEAAAAADLCTTETSAPAASTEKKIKPTPKTVEIIRLIQKDLDNDAICKRLDASAGNVRQVRSKLKNGRYSI